MSVTDNFGFDTNSWLRYVFFGYVIKILRELIFLKMSKKICEKFFNNGWSKENLIDTIVMVGDKTISNYIHKTTQVPIDFPVAQPLHTVEV